MNRKSKSIMASMGNWMLFGVFPKPKSALITAGYWFFFAIFPLILGITAYLIQVTTQCEINEGGPVNCMIAGVNIGGMLYFMAVSMWGLFITVPLGLLGLLATFVQFLVRSYISTKHQAK